MSVKKIVTSEQEGSTTGTNGVSDPNSFIYDTNGLIYYKKDHGTPAEMFMEPGVVYGSGYEGGEGGGRPVIKLRPDDYANADQQVVIDATAPNHIHIRAGGTKDASNAELILGGEKANLKVIDSGHDVRVNTYNADTDSYYGWTFGNDGVFYGPGEGAVQLYNINSPGQLNIVSQTEMRIEALGGDMNLYMDGGLYIGNSDSNNQILKRSDISNVSRVVDVPETASSTGTTGQIAVDSDYLYVCVASGNWKRVALSTWT